MEPRSVLHRKLEEVLGLQAAAALMEHLPPHKWDQLARREDVGRIEARLDRMDARFSEMEDRFALMDARFAGITAQLTAMDARFDRIGSEFEIVEQRRESTEHRILGAIRSEMAGLVSTQTRTIVVALVAAITANSGLVLAAARLV